MQRRRFFPARPVQQVPGRRVELAVQVRKEGVGATDVAATVPQTEVAWVSPAEALAGYLLRTETNDLEWEVLPEQWQGLTRVGPTWAPWRPHLVTGWRGVPWRKSAGDTPLPMTGPGWCCELIECTVSVFDPPGPACYMGMITGVTPDRVTWALNWQIEDGEAENLVPWDVGNTTWGEAVSTGGHVARTAGCTVLVYPHWHDGGTWGVEALTATAMVDGQAVGALRFVAIHSPW